jgi:hypothetical protein
MSINAATEVHAVPTSPYADLLIRVLKREEQGYPIELTLNNRLHFRRGYVNPSIAQWTPGPFAAEAGLNLFQLLMEDDQVASAWAMLRGSAPQRRIRLSIDAAELHSLPWELLRDPGDPESGLGIDLAAAEATPFSRYLAVPLDYPPPPADHRLKMLVAIANPARLQERFGLQPIDPDAEWEALRRATEGLNVELRLTPQPCTLEAIETGLLEGAHVLHIVAHGIWSESERKAVILLANRNNQVRFLHAQEHAEALARRLHAASAGVAQAAALRLIYLSSCLTATQDPSNAFAAFAPRLVQAGAPAVLAMQGLMAVESARVFSQVFYHQLLSHGQVDLAANQARATLLAGERPGAHIPVLFMGASDGHLLTPSPARAALAAISADEDFAWFAPASQSYLPLPVEAVHVTGEQNFHRFDAQPVEPTATIDVLKALGQIYPAHDAARSRRPAAPEEPGEQPSSSEAARERDRRAPTIVALAGGYGANRTTQLKRIVWQTAQDSLASYAAQLVVPVFVDLDHFRATGFSTNDPISDMARAALRRHWGDLDVARLASLLAGSSPTLRFVFHSSDDLPDAELLLVLKQLRLFAERYPQHQFVFDIQPDRLRQDLFAGVNLHVLILQPLDRRKLRHFLQGLPAGDLAGQQLLRCLDETGLYDLAAVPWFMLKLVESARRGHYPRSRSEFLQQVVSEAVAEAVELLTAGRQEGSLTRQGAIADPMERILYALAWRMQMGYTSTMPLEEAFTAMKPIRGDREYSLEELVDALIQSRLLVIQGRGLLRFAYSRIHAYCCAQAIVQRNDRMRRLDDITSTLGRLSRLHWWEDTLVFACGLMADDTRALEEFLAAIVYGMNLLESDRTFLAARCLSEIPAVGPTTRVLTNLTETVTAALVWRLSNQNEPSSVQRSRAANLLGQVASHAALEQLARTAYGKPRLDRHQRPDFDYSNVRMAAVIGLLRLDKGTQTELLAAIDPVLVDLLELWQGHHVAALAGWLQQKDNVGAQGLAALALGDLHMQLKLHPEESALTGLAQAALAALAASFLIDKPEEATRWAVTYALATIDLPSVQAAVLDPFFSNDAAYVNSEEERLEYYKSLAYLIGLLRWQSPVAREFLLVRCLLESRKAALASVAIDALARLADRNDKRLLERIALGCPDAEIMPCFKYLSPEDQVYLQRKATDALAVVGDAESIVLLREGRGSEAPWSPELELALYRTSEEIYWRLR